MPRRSVRLLSVLINVPAVQFVHKPTCSSNNELRYSEFEGMNQRLGVVGWSRMMSRLRDCITLNSFVLEEQREGMIMNLIHTQNNIFLCMYVFS